MEKVTIVSISDSMEGGSTNPILAQGVDKTGQMCSYVLKLYKSEYEKRSFPTIKECIVSFLAEEFELRIPPISLTIITEDLIKSNKRKILQFAKSELPLFDFCSPKLALEYLPTHSVGFNDEFEFDISQYSTIYAFDFLIFNNDRGGQNDKPNLLVDDEGFILIDHELSLSFLDNSKYFEYYEPGIHFIDSGIPDDAVLSQIKAHTLRGTTMYNFSKHLFYKKLHNIDKKEQLFEEFSFYLQNLSIGKFRHFLNLLLEVGLSSETSKNMIDYISFIQSNHQNFKNSLINSLL